MAGTRDALDSMAPWDAAPYFQTITEVVVSIPLSGTTQVIGADPMRVCLILSATGATGATVTTHADAVANQGLGVGTSIPPLVLAFSAVGPLCQMAWYCQGPGGGNVTAIAVSLSKWPKLRALNGANNNAEASQPTQRKRNRR